MVFFKKIAKKIARKIINSASFLLNILFGKSHCPVCGHRILGYNHFEVPYLDEFFKYRFIHPITAFETFNAVEYSCPICRGNDSTRLYALYLRQRLAKLKEETKFLDIAPSGQLVKLIKSFGLIKYRSADLYAEGVDDKVDLVDMNIYKDESFDMIICTHVLEHIQDDRKAMSELYRILRRGGEAIIQVPILTTIEEDYEDKAIADEPARWRHFGEATYVRVYSKKGFVEKLQSAGFVVGYLDVDYFGRDLFSKYCITDSSVLYVVKK